MKAEFNRILSTFQKIQVATPYAILNKLAKYPITAVFLFLTLQTLSVKASIFIHPDFPVDTGLFVSSFVDDFNRPSDAWRFGNDIVSNNPNGLMLRGSEVTLSGTAIHPDNLRTFTATLRWNFSKMGQPVLFVGWGKPHEWSSLDECQVYLSIRRKGEVTVMAGKQVIGEAQLIVPPDSIYKLTFTQELNRVVIKSDHGDIGFLLPDGFESRSGSLMLSSRDDSRQRSGGTIKMQRVEIRHSGKHAPLTEGERNNEINTWAKEKLQGNLSILDRFKAHIEAETSDGHWGYKTDIAVHPGLVKQGEKVTIEFKVKGAIPSPCTAYIEPDFLSDAPGAAEPVKLNWQSDNNGGYKAALSLTPQKMGNWRIVWQAGAEKLNRVFAVAGPGYMVCRILFTAQPGPWIKEHAPEAYDVIHEYGLTADYWSSDEWTSPFSRTPENLLTHFGFFSRNRHFWGDHVMPLANANWYIPNCPDGNLWRFGDDVQREGMQQASQLWDVLGIGPMEILGSYTFGHNSPRIARSLGVKVLDSFCQWQNWRDGGSDNSWLINNLGVPAWPYYVADDDFRKVAPGRSILAFTQNTNSNVRLYDIMTAEGQPNLSTRRRYGENTNQSMNIDRFQTIVDVWLAEALHQKEPLFISIGLENFTDSPDWNEANKLGVHYLCEQAKKKKLVFVSAVDIANYFERFYAAQPENWILWPDIYAGQAGGYKPRLLPERIEVNNRWFHTVHEAGKTLPRFFWDFTRPWSEPVWDDQKTIRLKYGLVDPDLLTADNCVPRMVNLDGVTCKVTIEPQPSGVLIKVSVDSPHDLNMLPLGVWNIPLRPESCKVAKVPEGARFVPVVDGSTDNLHGLLVLERVNKGHNTLTISLQGEPRALLEPEFKVGNDVRGRSFQRASGVTTAYVWLENSRQRIGTLTVRVSSGRQASVHYNDGRLEEARDGILRIKLDQTWQNESPMIIGLSAAEIQAAAEFIPDPPQP